MKTRIAVLMLVAVAGFCLGQEAPHEIRVVGGKAVDLTPVIQWHTDAPGVGRQERPMSHWKTILVKSINGRMGAWDDCAVVNESREPVSIYIANLSPEIRGPLMALNAAHARWQTSTNALATARAQAAAYSGSQAVALQRMRAMAERDAAAAGRASYQAKRDVDAAADVAQEAGRRKVFAMFTGQKYNGREIWDCGVRR